MDIKTFSELKEHDADLLAELMDDLSDQAETDAGDADGDDDYGGGDYGDYGDDGGSDDSGGFAWDQIPSAAPTPSPIPVTSAYGPLTFPGQSLPGALDQLGHNQPAEEEQHISLLAVWIKCFIDFHKELIDIVKRESIKSKFGPLSDNSFYVGIGFFTWGFIARMSETRVLFMKPSEAMLIGVAALGVSIALEHITKTHHVAMNDTSLDDGYTGQDGEEVIDILPSVPSDSDGIGGMPDFDSDGISGTDGTETLGGFEDMSQDDAYSLPLTEEDLAALASGDYSVPDEDEYKEGDEEEEEGEASEEGWADAEWGSDFLAEFNSDVAADVAGAMGIGTTVNSKLSALTAIVDAEPMINAGELSLEELFAQVRQALGGKSFYSLPRSSRLKLLAEILPRNYGDEIPEYSFTAKDFSAISPEDKLLYTNMFVKLNSALEEIAHREFTRGARFRILKIEKKPTSYLVYTTRPDGVKADTIVRNLGSVEKLFKESHLDNVRLNLYENQKNLLFSFGASDAKPFLLGDVLNMPGVIQQYCSMAFPVVLGVTDLGDVVIEEFDRFVHGAVSGASGGGKSSLLVSMLSQLVLLNSPEDLQLVILDPKGTPQLMKWAEIPHTIVARRDLEVLTDIVDACIAEGNYRQDMFCDAGASSLGAYRSMAKRDKDMKIVPRVFVIIDELNTLKGEMEIIDDKMHKSFLRSVQSMVVKLRTAGIHLIGSGQRLTNDALTKTARASCDFVACLRMTDRGNLEFMLDDVGGVASTPDPGDAVIKTNSIKTPTYIKVSAIHTDELSHDAYVAKLIEFIAAESHNLDIPPVDGLEHYRVKTTRGGNPQPTGSASRPQASTPDYLANFGLDFDTADSFTYPTEGFSSTDPYPYATDEEEEFESADFEVPPSQLSAPTQTVYPTADGLKMYLLRNLESTYMGLAELFPSELLDTAIEEGTVELLDNGTVYLNISALPQTEDAIIYYVKTRPKQFTLGELKAKFPIAVIMLVSQSKRVLRDDAGRYY